MTPDEIVTAIANQGGFDTSTEDASAAVLLSWANQARAEALATSKYRKALVSLGPTVSGQASYAVPENIVDLYSLRVDGSRPWLRISSTDLWEAQGSPYRLIDTPGAFAPSFESDGDATITLLPTPDTAGLVMEGVAAVTPDPMIAGGTQASVALPLDMHEPICVDGAIAIGYKRVKGDPAGAAQFRATWVEARDALKARGNSRIGKGAVTFRIET